MFGRGNVSPGGEAPAHESPSTAAPVDSDDRRRVFGDADFARHGEFSRAVGFDIKDHTNTLPDRAALDVLVRQSLRAQDKKRMWLEAELLARHGTNNIRPFFLFSQGVYDTPLGDWLMAVMGLMPYDDWNITYLPADAETAAALRLPLHPGQSIGAIDELVNDRMSALRTQFSEALGRSKEEFERSGDVETLDRFNHGVEKMRSGILEWAGKITPLAIGIIADAGRARP